MGQALPTETTGTLAFYGASTKKVRPADNILVNTTTTTGSIVTTGSLTVHAGDPWRYNNTATGLEFQGIGGTWQLTSPLVIEGDVTVTTGSVAAGGRIAAGAGTHPTNGTTLQGTSLAVGAGVTNNSSWATAGHSYFGTTSGATQNVLDVFSDANFVQFNAGNSGASNHIFRFSPNNKDGTIRIVGNGSNRAANIEVIGTGTGQSTLFLYRPGASSSSENVVTAVVIRGTSTGGTYDVQRSGADSALPVFNGISTFLCNVGLDGRLSVGHGDGTPTPATAGASLQGPSLGVGAGVANNASFATAGHSYFGTTSGGTQNVVDMWQDNNNAYYDLANSGASLGVVRFRGASGLLMQLLAQARGTNQNAHLLARGTGTGTTALLLYEPGSSGSTENTGDSLQLFRGADEANWIASNASGDIATKIINDDGTYVVNVSIEGRLGIGTVTPPTSGADLQTPSLDINVEEGQATITNGTSAVSVLSSVITGADVVLVTYPDDDNSGGALWVDSIEDGAEFFINSTNNVTDDTVVNWKIIH